MVNNKINVNVIDGLQPILDRIIDYDNITNCITEIPQDIKLEIESTTDQYPELILKAGSKVYVSTNGTFNPITIQSDIRGGGGLWTGDHRRELFVVYVPSANAILSLPVQYCFSQNTAPTSFLVDLYAGWFDTSTNTVKYTIDGGSNWIICSLPICLGRPGVEYVGWNGYLDQVFNGFGYIGSTAFILPGVKGLMSDGWNADGTYNNMISQLKSVYINTFTDTNSTRVLCLMFNNSGGYASGGMEEVDILPTSPVGMRRYYLKSKNEWFWWQNGVWTTDHLVKLADVVTESGVIKSLKPQLLFRAVDQNYFNKLDEEVAALDAQNVKLTGYQIINGDKIFTGQIIKAASSSTPMMTSRQNHVTLGTNPSANTNTYIASEDKSGADQSYISFEVRTDGSGVITIAARNNSSSDRASSGIQIARKLDGTSWTSIGTTTASAPTPATTDNSTKIATTAFFRNNMQVVEALPSTATNGVFYFVKE